MQGGLQLGTSEQRGSQLGVLQLGVSQLGGSELAYWVQAPLLPSLRASFQLTHAHFYLLQMSGVPQLV